jgi:TRAP-type C4-dicarboxylate transport system permease small subunit
LFFAISIFVYGGSRVVSDALTMEQTTPALGWKMGYVYLALPISGVFMVLYTIENLIETLVGGTEEEV